MPEAVATTDAMLADARTIFARLFVPVDFTMSSHRALGVALELKRAFGSQVCLFQLASESGGDEFLAGLGDPSSPADLIDGARDQLQRLVQNVAPEFLSDRFGLGFPGGVGPGELGGADFIDTSSL